jgi:hypothetical protein
MDPYWWTVVSVGIQRTRFHNGNLRMLKQPTITEQKIRSQMHKRDNAYTKFQKSYSIREEDRRTSSSAKQSKTAMKMKTASRNGRSTFQRVNVAPLEKNKKQKDGRRKE